MRKVLLINPPGINPYIRDCFCSHIAKASYIWHPLDLVILSGILSVNFDLKIIDAVASKENAFEIIKVIKKEKFFAVICLIGNISLKEDISFLKKIRKVHQKCFIIVLGDVALHKKERLLKKYPFIDGCILDFTSKDILKFLNRKNKFANGKIIENLIYRKNGKIIKGKRKSSSKLFTYPVPKHKLFPLSAYKLPMQKYTPFISLLTSDGCPFSCKFCPASNEILGFKLRKIENVLEELDYIYSLGIKELRFRDNTFISNKNYSIKLLNSMINKSYGFSYSCLTRVDTVNEKVLKLMKKSGCHTIQFGVESGSNKILNQFNKRTNTGQIKKVFAVCKKLKINTLAHFILGLPGETLKTMEKTLALAKQIEPDYVSFNIAKAIPETQLGKECLQKGWSQQNNLNINTPQLSFKDVLRFQKKAYREFYLRPKFILKKLIKISSLMELFSNLTNMLNLFFKAPKKSEWK